MGYGVLNSLSFGLIKFLPCTCNCSFGRPFGSQVFGDSSDDGELSDAESAFEPNATEDEEGS